MLKNVLIPGNKSESDRKNIMFLQNKEYIFENLEGSLLCYDFKTMLSF